MENKYLFLVTILIALYKNKLSLLKLVIKRILYRCKLYLNILYAYTHDTILYNPGLAIFLFNCVFFVKMGILYNFSNIYDYFGDFYILSTELKKKYFWFFWT